MTPIRLITLAPGHFHAALVQKRMHAGVEPHATVYGPLDADLVAHIDRVAGFNNRHDSPTSWTLDVRAGADYLERFESERAGNVVMLSGRNRPKIDLMLKAVSLGLHVLADKPWIVEAEDLPKIEEVLRDADAKGVLIGDMMTERHEVTSQIQRELVCTPEVFGAWQQGSREEPALVIESVHCLKKSVAGRPLLRPWWWFDAGISGESIADVGTHLADLSMWLISPDQAVDYRQDIQILAAERSPLLLQEKPFNDITGLSGFPRELLHAIRAGVLPYAGRNSVSFTLRGIQVKLETRWNYESAGAGDTHFAIARGSRSTVAIRQADEAGALPEVFVTANDPFDQSRVAKAVAATCAAWQDRFPGTHITDLGDLAHVVIPKKLRIGHEAHFAEVFAEFVKYYQDPELVPSWERPNVLAKYYVTTKAVELARACKPDDC